MKCRHVSTTEPRLLTGRHLRDCEASGCEGCEPCRDRHCRCGRHLDDQHPATCDRCVGFVRQDLADILKLCGRMPNEAQVRGVNSEAAMLAGPAANPEDWTRRQRLIVNAAAAAEDERDPAHKTLLAWIEDCRDEKHPLWVLGTWEQVWRDHLDHGTDALITVALAAGYLDTQLTYMAQQFEPDFEQFASEVRQCRGYLEDVLHDSRKPETGAPCPMCGERALVKDYGTTEAEDRWVCPGCDASYTEHDYQAKVSAIYVLHANALPIHDLAARLRISVVTLRTWAAPTRVWEDGGVVEAPPKLTCVGKSQGGRKLYSVETAERLRDAQFEDAM